MNKIGVKVDYFSATFPLDVDDDDSVPYKVHEMVKLISTYLNIRNHEILKVQYAQNNFKYQYNLGDYIVLRLDGPVNDCYQKTCHLELKGEGCRFFEARNQDKSWINFILFMAELNCRFKRIDLAVDDTAGDIVDMPWLLDKISKKQYVSIFRSDPEPHGTLESGLTIQFGSTKSPVQLVIYDKKMERKKRRKECDYSYWVRYEMRFRNETADRLAYALCKRYSKETLEFFRTDIQVFAFEQLYRILDIKEENNLEIRSQYKINTDPKWLSFLDNVKKGELEKMEDTSVKTFEDYMKTTEPYVLSWMLFKYMQSAKDPYLFVFNIFKFVRDAKTLSRRRFQRLNMFLDQTNLKTIDDVEMAALKAEFSGLVGEMEVPF